MPKPIVNQRKTMINRKYYNDIKNFHQQFAVGLKLGKYVQIDRKFNRVLLCGMGGSALFTELINDYLASIPEVTLRLEANRGYTLPLNVDKKTLILLSSYSGTTEETLSCLKEAENKELSFVILTTGGDLLQYAADNGTPLIKIPTGLQPRLSSGYFIGSILQLLANQGLIPDKLAAELQKTAKRAAKVEVNLRKARYLAAEIQGRVPIIYSTDNNRSLALISKIKFNENAKIQAFWNFFPEMNHNEMVGFTKLVSRPYFLIFKSKFTHPRNYLRMEVFAKLMREKNLPVEIIELEGKSVLEEILNGYHFIDYVTYYLAEKYEIDPEPVAMVEKFKALLKN